jgi:hypothetical protein
VANNWRPHETIRTNIRDARCFPHGDGAGRQGIQAGSAGDGLAELDCGGGEAGSHSGGVRAGGGKFRSRGDHAGLCDADVHPDLCGARGIRRLDVHVPHRAPRLDHEARQLHDQHGGDDRAPGGDPQNLTRP